MNIKAKISTEKLYLKLKEDVEFFKKLESETIADVDLEKCIEDYAAALLIYNGNIVSVTLL